MTAICIQAIDGKSHVESLISTFKAARCGAPCSRIARRSERAEIVPTLNGGVHKVRDQENHHERKFHLLQNGP